LLITGLVFNNLESETKVRS